MVDVDNAIGWGGWSQERLLVNGECLHAGGGLLRFYRSFGEPWLSERGEVTLRVRLIPLLHTVKCRLTIDDETAWRRETLSGEWLGRRHDWPDELEWKSSR